MLLETGKLKIKYSRFGVLEKQKDNLYLKDSAILFETRSFAKASNYSEIRAIFKKIEEKHPKIEVEAYKTQLLNIKDAFVTFGSTWRNIHLYSSVTKKLDPLYRVCYISNLTEQGNLIIKEHNDSRGAKFSSLYKLLYSKIRDLKDNSFKIYPDSITVSSSNIKVFVDIINEILLGVSNQEYELQKDESIYKINFSRDNETYWYNKVYWMPKDRQEVAYIFNSKFEENDVSGEVLITDDEALVAFESLIKTQNIGLNTTRKKEVITAIKKMLTSII